MIVLLQALPHCSQKPIDTDVEMNLTSLQTGKLKKKEFLYALNVFIIIIIIIKCYN